DELQANILTLQKIQDLKKVDLSDFIRTCPKDVKEMFSRLLSLIRSMKNPFLRDLLLKFFLDESFSDSFKKAAAAITYHHSYSGGLLEHTLSVCETCDHMAAKYSNVNRDLALAGAILHDIGKVHEYKVGVVIEMTDEGKLLGHIAMGHQMVAEKINEIEFFPADLRTHLLHILLSHHGQKEWGSPRCPQTLEAFLVYHADTLDADIGSFNLLMDESPNSDWSRYARNFERRVYLKFVSDQPYKEGDTEVGSEPDVESHRVNDHWSEEKDRLFVLDNNSSDNSPPNTDLP
ncbi:3'-5' exoribonuclease, partial [Candidatus Hakubella thermalkaliphila]